MEYSAQQLKFSLHLADNLLMQITQSPREVFLTRLKLVSDALRQYPHIVGEKNWRKFWQAAQEMPEVDQPGFLATHRQHIRAAQFCLTYKGDDLKRFPSPVNTPLGFTSLSAFLHFAKWQQWQSLIDTVTEDLKQMGKRGEPLTRKIVNQQLAQAKQQAKHPEIMDNPASLIGGSDQSGSFNTSLSGFKRLSATRAGDPQYSIVFDHPSFLWLDRIDSELEIGQRRRNYGKWVCSQPNLDGALALAERLLPAFAAGDLVSAKFLVNTTPLGNVYFLVYAEESNTSRKALLEQAAQVDSFFVYDTDCYEAEALGTTLQSYAAKIDPHSIDNIEQEIAHHLPRISDHSFFPSLGLSDVQLNIMSALLRMDQSAEPNDRWNYMALTYFAHFRSTLGAMLPVIADPSETLMFRVALESNRARTIPANLRPIKIG